MKFDIEKFKALALPIDEKLQEQLNSAIENEAWRLNLLHIAIRIRSIMKERGITQLQLASILGVSKSEVSKLLSGRENLSVKTIGKLETALGEPIITVVGSKTPLSELVPA